MHSNTAYIKRNTINKSWSAATFKPRSKDQNRCLFICVFKPSFKHDLGTSSDSLPGVNILEEGEGNLVLTWSHAKVPSRGRTHIMLVTRRTNSQQALNLGWFIDKWLLVNFLYKHSHAWVDIFWILCSCLCLYMRRCMCCGVCVCECKLHRLDCVS